MANAAVAAWTACIRDLQKLVDGSTPAPNTAQVVERVNKLAGDLETPLPNAAWKKTVHEIQVCQPINQSDASSYEHLKARGSHSQISQSHLIWQSNHAVNM
jgi:hypothetical protein